MVLTTSAFLIYFKLQLYTMNSQKPTLQLNFLATVRLIIFHLITLLFNDIQIDYFIYVAIQHSIICILGFHMTSYIGVGVKFKIETQ